MANPDDRMALVKVEGAHGRVALALHMTYYASLDPVRKDQVDRICTALGLDREDWPTREDWTEAAHAYQGTLRGIAPSLSDDLKKSIDRIEKALG